MPAQTNNFAPKMAVPQGAGPGRYASPQSANSKSNCCDSYAVTGWLYLFFRLLLQIIINLFDLLQFNKYISRCFFLINVIYMFSDSQYGSNQKFQQFPQNNVGDFNSYGQMNNNNFRSGAQRGGRFVSIQ